MTPTSRRRVLASGAVAMALGVGGCSAPEPAGGNATETADACGPDGRPGTDDPCETGDVPRPDEPTAGGVEPTEYPEFPERLAAETAGTYAAAFEKAYRRNDFVADAGHRGAPSLSVRTGVVTTVSLDCGVAVGVSGSIRTGGGYPEFTPSTDTPTPIPYYDGEFVAWYLVSTAAAARVESGGNVETPPEPPSFDDAEVVHCE